MTAETLIKIKAEEKDADKNPRQIRSAGYLPITIYGKGIESKSYKINTHEFELAYKNNIDATFEIEIGSKKIKAKIQELQKNYSLNQILNIEFKAL